MFDGLCYRLTLWPTGEPSRDEGKISTSSWRSIKDGRKRRRRGRKKMFKWAANQCRSHRHMTQHPAYQQAAPMARPRPLSNSGWPIHTCTSTYCDCFSAQKAKWKIANKETNVACFVPQSVWWWRCSGFELSTRSSSSRTSARLAETQRRHTSVQWWRRNRAVWGVWEAAVPLFTKPPTSHKRELS